MTKPRKIVLILASLLTMVVVLVRWHQPAEPEYAGVPLSRWMARYFIAQGQSPPSGNQTNNLIALRALGTNSIHYLLDLCQAPEGSPMLVQLEAQAQLEIHGGRLGLMVDRLIDRASNAKPRPVFGSWGTPLNPYWALMAIAPSRDVIEPILLKMYASRGTRRLALRLMDDLKVGSETLHPYVLRSLRDEDESLRDDASRVIYNQNLKSADLTEALNWALSVASPSNQMNVAFALAGMGTNGSAAVPFLLNLLNTVTNIGDRIYVAKLVCQADPKNPEGLKVLMNALHESSRRRWVIEILSAIYPRPVIPADQVGELLSDVGDTIEQIDVYLALGVPKNEIVATLVNAMEWKTGGYHVEAASKVLLRLVPNHPRAIAVLVTIAQADRLELGGGSFRFVDTEANEQAIHILGNAGPNATAAIPALKKMLENNSTPLKSEIEAALQRIESPQ
jgi:hypothetical protein